MSPASIERELALVAEYCDEHAKGTNSEPFGVPGYDHWLADRNEAPSGFTIGKLRARAKQNGFDPDTKEWVD